MKENKAFSGDGWFLGANGFDHEGWEMETMWKHPYSFQAFCK